MLLVAQFLGAVFVDQVKLDSQGPPVEASAAGACKQAKNDVRVC